MEHEPRKWGDATEPAASVPGPNFSQVRGRKRELVTEQLNSWNEGRPVPLNDLLRRWPVDPGADPDAGSLLLEDLLQRRRRGEDAIAQDYEQSYPGLKETLDHLVSQDALFRSLGRNGSNAPAALRLPDVGDELFGFRLRHPLGRGAFAKVFLAEQSDLAGRPVVLKVSAIEGTEPQTLAQLQHTHIVPIYSLHDDQVAGLRAVCMPYFGGATLSAILERVWATSPSPRAGSEFVVALAAVQSPAPEELDGGGATNLAGGPGEPRPVEEYPALARLSRLTYVQATAWVAAQLADGLQHAHQRGILHRDVKTSNILVSTEGEPLLLDFNLARNRRDEVLHASIGGTIAYMAPEHLRALVNRTAEQVDLVDHRADVYSLGMVLAEMLTGHRPFEQSASYSVIPMEVEAMALERSGTTPSVRSRQPDIPWGMESITRKCLAPDPADRYQQADHLAEDLRRFLDDRPLKHAPELSNSERIQKFLRRHPRLTSSGSVGAAAVLIVIAIGWALAGVRGHLWKTREQLGTVQARDRKRAHDAGTARALCLVNTTLDMQDHLRQGIAVCEATLALYGPATSSEWLRHPDYLRLAAPERLQVAEDRRELSLLLAGAQVRLAPESRDAPRRALALLEQVEAVAGLGPVKALWLDRANYWELLGEAEKAEEARRKADAIPATTAIDHYMLANVYARRRNAEGYARAVAELDVALDLNPRHYWSLVQRGLCHLERNELLAAAGDFGNCIGLWPEFAWGYFNRGYALDKSGDKEGAVRDYTSALDRDPTFTPALVNRGLALLETKRYARALADYDKALASGREDSTLHAGRGMALEGLGRHDEADEAFATAFSLARTLSAQAWICMRYSYGFSVAARLPDKAAVAFDGVLERAPRQPQALYGRAMLAMRRGSAEQAISYFDRALEASPNLMEARRYRAVLLARQGQFEAAEREVNRCLERDPETAATRYVAACVASLAAQSLANPEMVKQGLAFLERALDSGADPAEARKDPDLAGLRAHPRFQRLVSKERRTPLRRSPEL